MKMAASIATSIDNYEPIVYKEGIKSLHVVGTYDRSAGQMYITPSKSYLRQVVSPINTMSILRSLANMPNSKYVSAINLNKFSEDIMSMEPKKSCDIIELSQMAKNAIAIAISELEMGTSKTFSNIDELFDDLDSD